MKKRIPSIVMLIVLIIGAVLTGYGVTGRNIYNHAADMMGVSKKDAMTFIQAPDTLTEIGNVSAMGAEKVKSFLKDLGADAAKVDAAVDTRLKYETVAEDVADREKFL